MTLREARIGGTYTVSSMNLEKNILQRLGALGLNRGTNIKLLNRNRGGSVIIMVRGSRLAVGKKIAGAVQINITFTIPGLSL